MSRSLKPLKIEEVWDHKTGLHTDLLLDRNNKVFYGMVNAERVEAPTAVDCKKLLLEKLKPLNLEWIREIRIDTEKGHYYQDGSTSAHMKLSFSRHEYAISPTGAELEREFWTEEDEAHKDDDYWTWKGKRDRREAGTDIKNNGKFFKYTGVKIPYSEAAWASLLAIRGAIVAAHEKLNELLSGAKVETFLLSVKPNTQLRLEAPKEK
jgi:hypothetical protein